MIADLMRRATLPPPAVFQGVQKTDNGTGGYTSNILCTIPAAAQIGNVLGLIITFYPGNLSNRYIGSLDGVGGLYVAALTVGQVIGAWTVKGYYVNPSDGSTAVFLTKTAVAGDPGRSFNVGFANNAGSAFDGMSESVIFAYSKSLGVSVSAGSMTEGTTWVAPSITTTKRNRRIVAVWAVVSPQNLTTAPSGVTQRLNQNSSNSFAYVGDYVQVGSGATGTKTLVFPASGVTMTAWQIQL